MGLCQLLPLAWLGFRKKMSEFVTIALGDFKGTGSTFVVGFPYVLDYSRGTVGKALGSTIPMFCLPFVWVV